MNYIKYVNIKQGTKSLSRFSNGNTLPLVQRPFGFVSFSPQTDINRKYWFYHPEDMSFEGIRLTHQPSPWINDHAAIVMMPQSDTPHLTENMRWSGFEADETVLLPHYMKYHLNRSRSDIELTPTEYGACVRIKFDNESEKFMSILPVDGLCGYEFDSENDRLYCFTDCKQQKGYDSDKFRAYSVFQFEKGAIVSEKTIIENRDGKKNGISIEGEHAGIHLCLRDKETVFSMAQSYISYEQALVNLQNDSGYGSFDSLVSVNEKIWNDYLSRIEIEADEEKMKTFYSCMYRLFLFPHKAYETDKTGEKVHYAPCDGTVKRGVRYTDNGFWDTYRTVYPLFSIIAKEECREFAEGFIQDYKDGGWLPRWTSLDAKNCMPSTHIDAVIAECAVKGIISGELLQKAFEGMEKHANNDSDNIAYGREGCTEYVNKGYVFSDKHRNSVNLTLDAAYCDWCLGVVAEILGYKDKAKLYFDRSKNFKNLFDRETGFMRGRKENGEFSDDFDPVMWGWDYTEASAWQTTFDVQHDLDGLAELYGGSGKLISKLDEFFDTPPEYHVPGFRCEIHEMTEFAAGRWGQCAISNQPSFHIPFIYAYFGEQEKTDYWVRRLCDEAFSSADDGFPGDEDNGTMSAWYIFSAIGIYPLCPGKKEYIKFEGFAENVKILGQDFRKECL